MTLAPGDMRFIKDLMEGATRNVFDATRDYAVESRLQTLVETNKFASIPNMVASLRREKNAELERAIVEQLLNNETMFFRDVQPFDVLREQVMPEVIERTRYDRVINIWSAACSTGQEPYSIAMLLHMHFPTLVNWQLRILATDVSRLALARAKAGTFRQIEVNRGLPAPYLVKYFERHGMTWTIKPEIRQMVAFEALNLAEPLPTLPSFDIVFLRNAMIYFDLDTKRRVLTNVENQIRRGGYLFLGAAETTISLSENLTRMQDKTACYKRR